MQSTLPQLQRDRPPAPAPVSAPRPAAAQHGGYDVVVAGDEPGLSEHLAAWEDLARHAAEPNAFYEPWCLLPALRAFGRGLDLRFVLVYRPAGGGGGPPLLCGFFPLEAQRLHRLAPVRVLALWQHLYSFLGTPLLRAGSASGALEAFLDWLAQDRDGAALWKLDTVSADAAFAQALAEVRQRRPRPLFLLDSHCRALIQPGESAEAYLREVVSSRWLKDHRRKERALSGCGRLHRRVLTSEADVEGWAEMFLRLESGGWKGQEGTALACCPAAKAFFRDLVRTAFSRGRLQLIGLFLDDRPVALKCTLLASPQSPGQSSAGGFCFKIAYDEQLGQHSPGVLLELGVIEDLHRHRPAPWLDSCAAPNHPLFSRLWGQRRIVQTGYLASGRVPGDLIVSLMPLGRWLKSWLRRGPGSDEEGGTCPPRC